MITKAQLVGSVIGLIVLGFFIAWFFWPKPLPVDYRIQKAINERIVNEAYNRMYQRRMEHNAINAELVIVRAQGDSLHARLDSLQAQLDIKAIKHGQQQRFKDAKADALLRYLGTSPDSLYARSTGFDRQPAPVR